MERHPRRRHYFDPPRPDRRRRSRMIARSRPRLVYAGRWPFLVLAAVLVSAGIAVTATTGRDVLAWIPAVVLLAWLAYAIRIRRPVPAGRPGNGPDPEPGAGVREPRRPLPMSPAGAAERPLG